MQRDTPQGKGGNSLQLLPCVTVPRRQCHAGALGGRQLWRRIRRGLLRDRAKAVLSADIADVFRAQWLFGSW
jgi:hypothetical protein